MKHLVIFSHGFGTLKDDRGLFSDIASSFPDITPILFDYNQYDPTTNHIIVTPLTQQVEMLQLQIASALRNNPGAVIDMVCHSQGSIVTAIAAPIGVRRTVMLAPQTQISTEQMTARFSYSGASINIVGTSTIPRADGSTTIVNTDYWKSLENLNPLALFNELAHHTELTIFSAKEDEILGKVSYDGLDPSVHVEAMPASHNFDGAARQNLIIRLADILVLDEDNM